MRAWDANGYVSPGAQVFFYLSGTNTLQTPYSDEAGTIPASNPTIADANGFIPQRYVASDLKLVVQDADGATLYTLDPCPVSQSTGSSASLIGFSPTVNIAATDVQAAIELVDTGARSRETALGATKQPIDADLTALAALSTTGMMARTAANTYVMRTITAGSGISITDGNGVAGNPTIAATVSDWVEVSGSPFTLSGAAPYNITTGINYKHLRIVGIGITATVAGNRRFRVGNSGGFLSTSIYQQLQGAASTFVDVTDSTTAARQFIIEIQDFNTTNAYKPVMMLGSNSAAGWSTGISDSSAFDRIQIDNSAAATLGGTLRVYGKN